MGRIDLAASLSDARARVEAETRPEERGLAKFARLTRKDTRIRADQDAALTALARTVMRRRVRKVERITENTLIRIAIDLLLAHADDLRGSTEEELRKSVTSAGQNTGSSGAAHCGPADLLPPGAPEPSQSGSSEQPPSGSADAWDFAASPTSGDSSADPVRAQAGVQR